MTIEGEKDDISGVGQTEAAHDLCTSTFPPRRSAIICSLASAITASSTAAASAAKSFRVSSTSSTPTIEDRWFRCCGDGDRRGARNCWSLSLIAIDGREIEVKFKRHRARASPDRPARPARRGGHRHRAAARQPQGSLGISSSARAPGSPAGSRASREPVAFAPGAEIHAARHRPSHRCTSRRAAASSASTAIPTASSFRAMPRISSGALTDWLKREAKRDLLAASERHARAMGVSIPQALPFATRRAAGAHARPTAVSAIPGASSWRRRMCSIMSPRMKSRISST